MRASAAYNGYIITVWSVIPQGIPAIYCASSYHIPPHHAMLLLSLTTPELLELVLLQFLEQSIPFQDGKIFGVLGSPLAGHG